MHIRSSIVSSDHKDIRKSKLPWKQRNSIDKLKMIRPSDEGTADVEEHSSSLSSFFAVIFKVYCADHTYTTMKMRVDTPASRIIRVAADKLGLRSDQPEDLKLCEVRSSGGQFHQKETKMAHGLISLCRKDHLQGKRCERVVWIDAQRSTVPRARRSPRRSGT